MLLKEAAARSVTTSAPCARALQGWRPDGAAVLGFVLVSAYVLPARLVLVGLGAAGRPALVLGVALLAWWALTSLLPGRFPPGPQPVRVGVWFFLVTFLISMALGFARALTEAEISSTDRSLLRYLGLVGITLVACDGIRSRARLDSLLRVLLGAGAFMAVVGSLQFLVGVDVTPRLRLPGLTQNGDLIGIAGRGAGFNRVAGTAGHYIEFGVLLALLVPIALHFGLYSRTRLRRATFMACAAFFVLASFYSVSRSAVVGLGVAALFTATGWAWRRKANLAALGVLFIIGVQAVQPGLLGTLRSLFRNIENDPSVEGRTNDYAVISPLIAERPWFGRGPGTYSPEQYVLLDNQWLNWLVTGGVIGVVALLVLFLTGVVLAERTGRWARSEEDRNLGRAIGASLIGAAVISFTFDSFSFTTFAVTVFALIGAAGALWRLADRPVPTDRTSRPGVPE